MVLVYSQVMMKMAIHILACWEELQIKLNMLQIFRINLQVLNSLSAILTNAVKALRDSFDSISEQGIICSIKLLCSHSTKQGPFLYSKKKYQLL